MLTQENDPGLRHFGYLLQDDGLQPEADTSWWNHDDHGRISHAVVAYRPMTEIPSSHTYWGQLQRLTADMESDSGNSEEDWLKFPFLTPAGVYGQMVATGFASREIHIETLRQFARIREAEWARQALNGAAAMDPTISGG
jgi:hypothetical protein